MREFYATSYSNVHRGVYTLSERATEGYEGAREKIRAFLNAQSTREVIFVRQATEGLNLVAYAWGLDNLGPGDLAIVTELEHHSNFVPWQQIAKRTGAEFRMIPIDDLGELRMDLLDEVAAGGNVKVVAANLVSNSLGTINPIEKLAAWAHEQRRDHGRRRRAGRAAPADRRADARRRLRRLLVAQDVRPDRRRRPLGPPRAARGDVAVQLRRLDDPLGQGRGDALERAARTSSRRARPRSRRRTGSASRSTTSRRSGSRRSSSTSTSSRSTRSSSSPSCRS